MKKKVAINGFGRIGRAVFKIILEKHPEIEVVAINDLTDTETLLHLLSYDSVYGGYKKAVLNDGFLEVEREDGKQKTRLFAEKDPSFLPWKDLSVDVVLECTGLLTEFKEAKKHLDAGAKKVIISAPSKSPEEIKSFVLGVNEETYDDSKDHIMDMGSCTTNCIAPVLKVLQDSFGLEKVSFNTIHSYTANQNLQDGPHKDLRRARAAATNIIPTTTGAAKAIGRVIPDIKGKVEGLAMRVPTIAVSVVDLSCILKKEISKEELNHTLREASGRESLNKILCVEGKPLVSSDYIGSSYSSIVDSQMTLTQENFVKIISWYDNEWGYSCRLAEFADYVIKKI